MTYWNRPKKERELINNAYNAEVALIDTLSSATNPYFAQVMKLPDGAEIWEGISFALELKYHSAEK